MTRPPLRFGNLFWAACLILVGAAVTLLSVLPSRAAAQPAPLVVDADQVIYEQLTGRVEASGHVRLQYRGIRLFADYALFELQTELLTARGHVILIDAQGRELRGESLTYDARLDIADITRAETVVERVYVRSEGLHTEPGHITATEATATTCPPAHPAYRVTAAQIEITPGDRLVARRATLWVGRYRVLSLPVFTVSLRSAEETARSFPRFGYSTADGFWVDYTYRYAIGAAPATLYTKYGTRVGPIVRNSVTYRRPPFALELTIGRNQDEDLNVFDQAELTLSYLERQIPGWPLVYSASIDTGSFRDLATGVATARSGYTVGLRTQPIMLGSQTGWQAAASWSDAWYGTGNRQGIVRIDSSLTHAFGSRDTVSLTYSRLEVYGATPFVFDAVDPGDLTNRAALQYVRTGERRGAATRLTVGTAYNFRDATTSAILGYGERVPERYHWSILSEYNLGTTDTKLTADAGLAVGRGTYFTVQAVYHTLTGRYEDLDYILTSRLCDCVDISLKYRQVRRELWLEIGLTAFPQSRLQLKRTGP